MKQPPTSPTCRIAPGLETDPVALRLAALSAKLAPSAKVVITTSDAIGEVPEGALLSAQSKLARMGVESATAFQWVARNEKSVDWNKVRTEEELMGAAASRFMERAKEENYLLRLDASSGAAQTEVNALRQMAAGEPQAENVLRQYEANPAQRWGELLGYVNSQRVQNVRDWKSYLTQGNEEYAKDPFWQDCVWDIVDGALTSDRNRGLGTTVHLNQGVLAELRQSINGKTQPVALTANYSKLQAEHARAAAAITVRTESARQWVYIPSKTEDEVNFQANVQKLKDLSCTSWCTKTYNAEPYLARGGFWLLMEGNKSVCAIRLVGDQIQEIQGVKNNSEIPPEAGPDIDDLLAARPELKNVNLWRAKNPGATPATLEYLGHAEEIRVREAVAIHPNTPAATLDLLAADAELIVRIAVVRSPKAPGTALARLATDEDSRIRSYVASNPNTPPKALDRLAFDHANGVQDGVAKNPSTARETLIRLAFDEDDIHSWNNYIRRIVLLHPNLSEEVLEQLAVHPSLNLRCAAASCERTPAAALERLSEATDEEILRSLTSNPNVPAAILVKLAAAEHVYVRQRVASHERTPVTTLRMLAKDRKLEVRTQLLYNPSLSGELLHLLATDRNRVIREKVVLHAKTRPATLAVLAKDKVLGIRELVAQDSRTPEAALALLSEDPQLQRYVARNQNTPPSTLAALAAGGNWSICELVSKHPRTTAETLTELAKNDTGSDVELARNPNTPAEALTLLCRPTQYQFAFSQTASLLSQHHNAPAEVLKILAAVKNATVRLQVAKHQHTPAETLALLANGKDFDVQKAAAENGHTPAVNLMELAKSNIWYIRESAAQNPSIPPEGLLMLAADKEATVREAVAHHELLPASALILLAADKLHQVRRAVAENPNTPEATLRSLARDEDLLVHRGVAINPATPAEVLGWLVSSEDWRVRESVAANDSATPAILTLLAADPRGEVRSVVGRHANTPAAVLMQYATGEDYESRAAAASNPNTPIDGLTILAMEDSRLIQAKLTRNPSTPPAILTKWAFARDQLMFQADIAANPSTPPETLGLLAAVDVQAVRKNVATNPKTPRSALLLLAEDDVWEIRSAAAKHQTLLAPEPKPEPVVVSQPEPQPRVFDKKRKDQLVFNFSLSGEGVEAFYDPKTDTTVFLQDKIATVERATALFFHETTGHRNVTLFAKTPEGKAELAAILNSAEPQLMTELPALLKATGHKSLADLKQDYGFGDTEEGKTAVLGELLARHAERLADTEAPTWWEMLVNKVEVWMAKHVGTRLGEDAITTWLARLPARLPAVEIELERFGAYPEGYTQQYQAPRPQAPTYHLPRSYGHDVA